MPDDEQVAEQTVDELGISAEVASTLSELDEKARAAAPGELVGETELAPGAVVRRKGQSTMVRMGETELPRRVKVFDRWAQPSMVPTAQIHYYLSKRDAKGNRVFYTKPPAGVTPPEPIKETCPICLKRDVRKKFYDEYDFEGHMETFHPREWRIIQRNADRERQQVLSPEQILVALAQMKPAQKRMVNAALGTTENRRGRARKEA